MKYIFRIIIFIIIVIFSVPLIVLSLLLSLYHWDIDIFHSLTEDLDEGSFITSLKKHWGK